MLRCVTVFWATCIIDGEVNAQREFETQQKHSPNERQKEKEPLLAKSSCSDLTRLAPNSVCLAGHGPLGRAGSLWFRRIHCTGSMSREHFTPQIFPGVYFRMLNNFCCLSKERRWDFFSEEVHQWNFLRHFDHAGRELTQEEVNTVAGRVWDLKPVWESSPPWRMWHLSAVMSNLLMSITAAE